MPLNAQGAFDLGLGGDEQEYLNHLTLTEENIGGGSFTVTYNVGIPLIDMKSHTKCVQTFEEFGSRFVLIHKDGFEVSVKLPIFRVLERILI